MSKCVFIYVLRKYRWWKLSVDLYLTCRKAWLVNWLHCSRQCVTWLVVKEKNCSVFFLPPFFVFLFLLKFYFLLVAAFKLLPRQSRRIPQLQRNQLGVVGWRLMGNLLLSPPPTSQIPPPLSPWLPICMSSPARGSTPPPRETWSFKCRSLSFSEMKHDLTGFFSYASLVFIHLHITLHNEDV